MTVVFIQMNEKGESSGVWALATTLFFEVVYTVTVTVTEYLFVPERGVEKKTKVTVNVTVTDYRMSLVTVTAYVARINTP
jgi:hypothetical protein